MNVFNIVYILHRFPALTETFIAEEIRGIINRGGRIKIYSLLPAKKEPVHPVSQELLPYVHSVPGFFSPSLWWAQSYYLFKSPSLYLLLLSTLLTQPKPYISAVIKRLAIFLKAVWLVKELKGSDTQLVHTHFAWLSAAAAMVVSQFLKLPFTITAHAYDIFSHKNDLLKLTTNKADRVITISDFNKQAILKASNILDEHKIEVIHCGVDLNTFTYNKKCQSNRILQITSIGRLEEKKGHEYLIRACLALNSRNIDFQCVIIGEGRLKETLQRLIQVQKLEDRVALVGAKDQDWVRERLNKSDIFVLACVITKEGERDGIPVSIMEALATGTPVITTAVSGIPELIKHVETGLLVPERDSEAIADAVVYLMKNPILCQKLVNNGREIVEREYDIKKNVGRLGELFQLIIEERMK